MLINRNFTCIRIHVQDGNKNVYIIDKKRVLLGTILFKGLFFYFFVALEDADLFDFLQEVYMPYINKYICYMPDGNCVHGRNNYSKLENNTKWKREVHLLAQFVKHGKKIKK